MDARRLARFAPGMLTLWCLSLTASETASLSAGVAPGASPPSSEAVPEPSGRGAPAVSGPITRAQALSLALENHASLAAATWAVEAAEGRVDQDRLRPNPEAEIEVEDIASRGDASLLGETVTTVRVSQPLELGGKRLARTRLAELDRDLGEWDRRGLMEDVRRDTAVRFATLLAAQERVRLLRDAGALAERLLETVSDRVAAGKDSPVELSKARVALASRRVELRRAEGEVETARVALAAQWGHAEATFTTAEGDFASVPEVPSLEQLTSELSATPDLARWATERAQRTAAMAVARAGRVPDLTLGAGTAWSRGEDDVTFELSASLPLPLFDRNQGAIREASARLHQAADEQRALQTEMRAALVARRQELLSARQEAVTVQDEILPEAQRAFEMARAAFAAGKTGYLDVLDAQQTLFEAQTQHVEALAACQVAVAEIERITGYRFSH